MLKFYYLFIFLFALQCVPSVASNREIVHRCTGESREKPEAPSLVVLSGVGPLKEHFHGASSVARPMGKVQSPNCRDEAVTLPQVVPQKESDAQDLDSLDKLALGVAIFISKLDTMRLGRIIKKQAENENGSDAYGARLISIKGWVYAAAEEGAFHFVPTSGNRVVYCLSQCQAATVFQYLQKRYMRAKQKRQGSVIS